MKISNFIRWLWDSHRSTCSHLCRGATCPSPGLQAELSWYIRCDWWSLRGIYLHVSPYMGTFLKNYFMFTFSYSWGMRPDMRTMERTHREGGHCGPSFVLYLVEEKAGAGLKEFFLWECFVGTERQRVRELLWPNSGVPRNSWVYLQGT